jgi:hypothetical protein
MADDYLQPGEMRRIIAEAITEFAKYDIPLLHLHVNERSIAHRLAIYIECRTNGWNVDCEYNRDRSRPKMRQSDKKKIIPDIIVHRRNTPKNLLIVEIKKTSHTPKTIGDAKRRAFDLTGCWTTEFPHYCHAVVMVFPVRKRDDRVVECEWYHRNGCGKVTGQAPFQVCEDVGLEAGGAA